MPVRAEVTSPHCDSITLLDSKKTMKNDPTKESSFRKNERYRFELFPNLEDREWFLSSI